MLNNFISIISDFKMSCTEWVYLQQKNKPQGNSLAGGIFVLFAAGLQIGWIYNGEIQTLKWAQNHSNFAVITTYVAFYVTAICGLYMALMVIERLSKRDIYVSLNFFAKNSSISKNKVIFSSLH